MTSLLPKTGRYIFSQNRTIEIYIHSISRTYSQGAYAILPTYLYLPFTLPTAQHTQGCEHGSITQIIFASWFPLSSSSFGCAVINWLGLTFIFTVWQL
jgi:hypothetical protein